MKDEQDDAGSYDQHTNLDSCEDVDVDDNIEGRKRGMLVRGYSSGLDVCAVEVRAHVRA